MSNVRIEPTPELTALLVKTGSPNQVEAIAAQAEFASALELPLRQGILFGDILSDIFEPILIQAGAPAQFPLDFVAPGTESEYVAYTIPNQGYIPEKHIEGDYVQITTYEVGAAIDWLLKYARDARWDIVSAALDNLQAQFTKKKNDDGWHTILAAGVDRNIVVVDANANNGQFTKRLVSLGKTVMRRNGGGNSTSTNRGKLTDMFTSPESIEDIRNWGIDQLDEITRREIWMAADGAINRVFGVNLHDLDELGEGQEYQNYYENDLAGTVPSGHSEMAVGLDLSRRDSFVMPYRENVSVYSDPNMHRQRRAGYYGWAEYGFGVLDGRRTLLFAI